MIVVINKIETTPCHIIDLDCLSRNLNGPIKHIRTNAYCNILLALKGFSSSQILPYMATGLDGVSASGAYEAKLGKEAIGKYVCTYSPIYKDDEIELILQNSDSIVFNSINQYLKYHDLAIEHNTSCGIRINPNYSFLPDSFRANPCQSYSRLGILYKNMPDINMFGKNKIEGIHLHTMCDQYADDFEKTIDFIIQNYSPYLKQIKWLNLGGGQMYAQKDYDLEKAIKCINKLHSMFDLDVYLEPCSGIMTNCGFFATSVIDIIENDMRIAVIDASAVCHMPDVVFNDWRHDICGADDADVYPYKYRIAGSSCYAGDIWGDYSFPRPLSIGDNIIFKDTAMYSMVKNNSFNGLKMPSVATYSKNKGIELLKTYDYNIFLSCQ